MLLFYEKINGLGRHVILSSYDGTLFLQSKKMQKQLVNFFSRHRQASSFAELKEFLLRNELTLF